MTANTVSPAASTKPVALVTGATGGMGTAIVRELLHTHEVIAQGRDAEKLAALAKLSGVTVWQVDLAAATQPETASEQLEYLRALPRLDVVVHAAAIANSETVESATAAQWQQMLNLNVVAPALVTQAILPQLRASRGTAIFIGSGASVRANKNTALYTSSKHALKGLTDSLRLDEMEHGVRITTVAPGPTDTQMLRGLIAAENYHAELYIQPESIARTVRFVVDAGADVQLTDVFVRPRAEIAR